jgi:hypothetical protein
MPIEFLTDEQEQAYGHYVRPPSTQQLSRYFHLDDADRERVYERRGADNKLGFAVQLTTVRFLGTFLAEPTDVPSDVVAYVAAQLGIHDVACLADYAARPATAWEHAAEIRRIYGYRDFTDPAEGFRLVRWLYTRAWLSLEQPSVLFDLATARLVERQVLLPGVSILALSPAFGSGPMRACIGSWRACHPPSNAIGSKSCWSFRPVRDDRHLTDCGGGQPSPPRRDWWRRCGDSMTPERSA